MTDLSQRASLRKLLENSGLRYRISAKTEDDEWLNPSLLTNDGENGTAETKYILNTEDEGISRFVLNTDGDEERAIGWQRFVFPITRKKEDGEAEDVTDEIEIVVEVTGDGAIPEDIPWDSESEASFDPALLNDESVHADRVAGLEDEKKRLERFLDEADEDWGLSESTGIILEGPPGTGKTELVMEVCQEQYGSIPVMISGPEILSKWVGESERTLREKFDEAWNTEHKVLYIDELDAIAQSRSEVSESYSAQIVAQLLILLDGVEAKEQSDDVDRSLKVVASTNLSHVVDPALRRPGRLGNRPIQFGRPSRTERKAILHHYLEDVYVSEDGKLSEELAAFVRGDDLTHLESVVEETEGFTGADIEDLVQETVSQVLESESQQLTRELLERTIVHSDFEAGQDFSEQSVSIADKQSTNPFDIASPEKQPAVYYVGSEDPAKVAESYFKRVAKSESNPDYSYKFRTVSPKDLLDSDSTRAQEKTVQAFQHRENERIALYLENAELLIQSQAQSTLVDRLLGVINEQFLQWEAENLLLLPESGSGILDTID